MIPFFAPRANLPISADSTGRYLPWLVAMMVFLAVLSLAGVLAVGGVLEDWRRDVSGTVTVQIAPATAADPTAAKAETDRRVTQALAILARPSLRCTGRTAVRIQPGRPAGAVAGVVGSGE